MNFSFECANWRDGVKGVGPGVVALGAAAFGDIGMPPGHVGLGSNYVLISSSLVSSFGIWSRAGTAIKLFGTNEGTYVWGPPGKTFADGFLISVSTHPTGLTGSGGGFTFTTFEVKNFGSDYLGTIFYGDNSLNVLQLLSIGIALGGQIISVQVIDTSSLALPALCPSGTCV